MARQDLTIKMHLVPDDLTMRAILFLLNICQECNPDKMVAMVPAKDRYEYEIIQRGNKDETD